MKIAFIKGNKYIIIAHVAMILAVLISSELFDSVEISSWIMVISLGLLTIYYIVFHVVKLKYIPKSDMLIALCDIAIWLALLATFVHWSNLSGFDRLIYVVYPILAGIFFICLLILNFIVFLVKQVREN